MLNAELEINYLFEAVPLLDQYMGSKEVSWQLPGIAREPGYGFGALTIGVVLLMLKRLNLAPLVAIVPALGSDRLGCGTRFALGVHSPRGACDAAL